MAEYTRKKNVLKEVAKDGETIRCKSINAAKRKSRELQAAGHTVSKVK